MITFIVFNYKNHICIFFLCTRKGQQCVVMANLIFYSFSWHDITFTVFPRYSTVQSRPTSSSLVIIHFRRENVRYCFIFNIYLRNVFFCFFFFVYRTILITQGVLFSANWNTINCDLMNNTSIAIDNVGSDIKLSAGSITPANLIVTRVRFRHRRYSALTTI